MHVGALVLEFVAQLRKDEDTLIQLETVLKALRVFWERCQHDAQVVDHVKVIFRASDGKEVYRPSSHAWNDALDFCPFALAKRRVRGLALALKGRS